VVYSFCDDRVPFVTRIPAPAVTLLRFKRHLPKRGNYRYFFKKQCEEFGLVMEELTDDQATVPTFEGRVFAQVRRCD